MKLRTVFQIGLVLVALLSGTTVYGQLTGPTTSGVVLLDGSNPTPVVTGLNTLTSCFVMRNTATTPGVTASTFTVQFTAGAALLNIYAWKPTSSSVTTLVASTDTDIVTWFCTGRTN